MHCFQQLPSAFYDCTTINKTTNNKRSINTCFEFRRNISIPTQRVLYDKIRNSTWVRHPTLTTCTHWFHTIHGCVIQQSKIYSRSTHNCRSGMTTVVQNKTRHTTNEIAWTDCLFLRISQQSTKIRICEKQIHNNCTRRLTTNRC